MDDQAALIAPRVAMAAASWFNAPADVETYRRLAAALGSRTPTARRLCEDATVDDLLDDLVEVAPPTPLGEGIAELEAVLRRQAPRER